MRIPSEDHGVHANLIEGPYDAGRERHVPRQRRVCGFLEGPFDIYGEPHSTSPVVGAVTLSRSDGANSSFSFISDHVPAIILCSDAHHP